MSTGWTLGYVMWNVDLPRLLTMNMYWKNHPPMHLLLAGYVGYKPAEDTSNVEQTEAEQEAMLQQVMATLPKYTFTPPKVVIHNEHGPKP